MSTKEAKAGLAQESPFADEKDGDPGLKFLKEINLTPSEEEELATLARGWIPELIAFEKGKTEDGWTAGSTMFGVHVCSKAKPPEEESSIVMCKGQMPLVPEVNMKLLQVQFIEVYNNTTVLAQQMRASDPMSRETKILYQIPCGDDEFIRIVWGSFKAAGVAWARDFCFLQHGCTTTDPDTGERLFAIVAGSIERPEVPDMENLCKRIRSNVKTSGYVFRESADGTMRTSYVVNVNPGGWIPSRIVNIICTNQAMNVSRVANKLVNTTKALKALEMEPPIRSTDIAWRCSEEMPLSHPAAGAAPSTVNVKLWANNKIWFRLKGASSEITTDWTPKEAASTVGAGAWELCQAETVMGVSFKLKPLGEDAVPCALEFKCGGWMKGVTLYYAIDVST